jgi:hypothetical protein
MSLDKYLSKSIKLNDDRVNHCLNLGQQGEDLFRQLTQAIKTDVAEDKQHIDFDWDGKKIDVKGLKPMHKQGYILLEFLNVWGYHGWCAKESKADYIAFQFPEAFYVFKKEDLRARAIQLCEKFSEDTILRQNRVKPHDGLGKWIGRYGKKDVFTYLRFVDVKDLIYDTIKI